MIKRSSKKRAAAKKVHTVNCNGCSGFYVSAVCIHPPKNERGLKIVCPSCFRQYFGGTASPMPADTTHLADRYGVYLSAKTAGILSNANGGLVNAGGMNMVNAGGMNMVGNNGAN